MAFCFFMRRKSSIDPVVANDQMSRIPTSAGTVPPDLDRTAGESVMEQHTTFGPIDDETPTPPPSRIEQIPPVRREMREIEAEPDDRVLEEAGYGYGV
jgi:hypothetical protein